MGKLSTKEPFNATKTETGILWEVEFNKNIQSLTLLTAFAVKLEISIQEPQTDATSIAKATISHFALVLTVEEFQILKIDSSQSSRSHPTRTIAQLEKMR